MTLINTPLQIFSIVTNIRESFEKNLKRPNLFKLVNSKRFERMPSPVVRRYNSFFNDIENSLYSLIDLTLFVYYYYYKNKIFRLQMIDAEYINTVIDYLSDTRYERDKIFIRSINENIKLDSLKDYFTINEKGENLIYELIQKDYVSPITFIKNIELMEDISESKSKEVSRFFKISQLIKREMTKREKEKKTN